MLAVARAKLPPGVELTCSATLPERDCSRDGSGGGGGSGVGSGSGGSSYGYDAVVANWTLHFITDLVALAVGEPVIKC